jgi:conjugative relaxase-like TrwC/TraI family protein
VLRINAISDSSGAYYLDDRALEVTDLFDAVSSGDWCGSAAARLGLSGAVMASDLASVLSGRPPEGTLSPDPRRTRTAYDLIFAAPKPVSALFALEPDPVARSVVAAHHRGVEAALSYLELRAAVVRRSAAGQPRGLEAEGLTAARFTHGLSRSGDPHLHSHLVVANMARDPEGRFGSLDARALRAHAPAAEALYRAQMRRDLSVTLDVEWQRGHDGLERISGISDALCVALSGRSADARARMPSRPAKEQASARSAAAAVWAERRRQAPMIEDRGRASVRAGEIDEHRFASALFDRSPSPRTVVAAFADAAWGGVDASLVLKGLERLASDLGHGVHEPLLAAGSVVPAGRVLRALGPRPTERGALEAWWRRSEAIERIVVDRTLSAVERAAREPLGR